MPCRWSHTRLRTKPAAMHQSGRASARTARSCSMPTGSCAMMSAIRDMLHSKGRRRGICRASGSNCAASGTRWPASTRPGAVRWPGRWSPPSPSSTARAAKRRLLKLINDFKQLMLEDREAAYEAMIASGLVQFAVAEASVEEIDRFNILQATFLAMRRALQALSEQPDVVLIDGNQVPPRSRLPRRDHRRRRRALLFDRRRLDLRQGDARSLHGALAEVLPGLRLGDQSRLRQRGASRRRSTGSARRRTTA